MHPELIFPTIHFHHLFFFFFVLPITEHMIKAKVETGLGCNLHSFTDRLLTPRAFGYTSAVLVHQGKPLDT